MKITNIAGYKFLPLQGLSSLRDELTSKCCEQELMGTILLSSEGININLAGKGDQISVFKNFLNQDIRFKDLSFHMTYSSFVPFQSLKVKIKKEIITLRCSEAVPSQNHEAPRISPKELKHWLDEGREMTLLDTRNDYEVQFGTFNTAKQLSLKNFGELPTSRSTIEKNKPIVMFCTGGIRCEKAGLLLLEQGFSNVYQLDGGILGYFAAVGGAHYHGECFVFDERIALDTELVDTDTNQCYLCQGPIKNIDQSNIAKQCISCLS